MITRPLELESRLSPPPRDLDFVSWVNVAVIALFFGLFWSPSILLPGVPVGVGGQNSLELPDGGQASEEVRTGQASVVVSYRRDNVILFEGGMFSLAALQKQMAGYAKKHPGAVMLVRVDRQVSMQAFMDLCNMAHEVGFVRVVVAAEPQEPANPVK